MPVTALSAHMRFYTAHMSAVYIPYLHIQEEKWQEAITNDLDPFPTLALSFTQFLPLAKILPSSSE